MIVTDNSIFQLKPLPVCPICNLAVALEAAKTDEDGRAMHEDCYLLKLGLKRTINA